MTLNPKVGVYFVAVVPQFVAPGPGASLRVALLLVVYGALCLVFWTAFVTGLHHAPITRQRLVSSLVAATREHLVKTIAEGVEDQEEADACVRAGFSHGQGYHYARPAPFEKFLEEKKR